MTVSDVASPDGPDPARPEAADAQVPEVADAEALEPRDAEALEPRDAEALGLQPRRGWWRLLARIGIWTVATLLVLALVTTGVVIWSVRRSFPDHGGELTLPGLSAPVTVYRDRYGIPQIYAKTSADLFRAQGYVHAQDRFWEMDFRRHVTAGRVAELFGADAVASDAFLRTLGWRRVAEQELTLVSAETRGFLEAYAAGVNAWIEATGGPSPSGAKSLEYAVLGLTNGDYTIEPWSPVDTLAWLKAMAWDLRGNMESEIDRALLLAHGLTRDEVAQLYPAYPYDRYRPIVGRGAVVDGAFDADVALTPRSSGTAGTAPAALWRDAAPALSALSATVDRLPHLMGSGESGIGSNSWVIGGALSATGKPLLANDPHLSPSMPGIWYQMGLHCECEYNVEGFTFSGVPGVVIGHNERIAWAMTNLDPDVADLYLEKLDGDRVFDGSTWTDLSKRDEVIKVAGGQPVTITVRSSKHGPLMSDRSGQSLTIAANPGVNPGGTPLPVLEPAPSPSVTLDRAAPGVPAAARSIPYGLALRWTALDPGRTIEALFALNQAGNWSEFRSAASLFEVPAQNLIYADVDGNIGYQAPGRIPVRGAGDGTWPAPGWLPAYDWKGYVPFKELPVVYNPPDGWIVTANQAVVGEQYQNMITRDWTYGQRSQRIMDMISERAAKGKISAEDIRQMQFDNRNSLAPMVVGVLTKGRFDTMSSKYDVRGAVNLLRGWDFQQSEASAAAALYNVFWRSLLTRTFDELPADRKPTGGNRWWEVVRALIFQPDSPWWDDASTPGIEHMEDIFWLALGDALAELTKRLGDDMADWRWGDLHTLELVNATFGESGIGPIEWLFNRGPKGTSGGGAIVNATGWSADAGYEVDAAPSMRMIVDMSHLEQSRWIQLTGNSGHAFHPNYDDQFELWRTGQNLPMRWDRASITAEAKHTLTLRSP